MICRTDKLIEPKFTKQGFADISSGDQVLDEIMIFDRVLSSQEIAMPYQAK